LPAIFESLPISFGNSTRLTSGSSFVKTRTMLRSNQLAMALAILAVGMRLVAIEQPFVDKWSWRESDVAAIAQNFYKGGFRFASPQIDWAGDQPGYVGTEFPILPFLAALSYKFLVHARCSIAGPGHHWPLFLWLLDH
jgi:hypothetical protein